jgi:uncharacterized phage protein (TIGR01671 family)
MNTKELYELFPQNHMFRAWDNELKKWICKDFHIIGEVMLFDFIEGYISANHLNRPTLDRLGDIVITQSSNLLDRLGVNLYQGDIIKYPVRVYKDNHRRDETPTDDWEGNNIEHRFDFIELMGGSFRASKSNMGWEGENLIYLKYSEKVGNIFENPELVQITIPNE